FGVLAKLGTRRLVDLGLGVSVGRHGALVRVRHGLVVFVLTHGTNSTLLTLASSPTFSTTIRILHPLVACSGAPAFEGLTVTATSTCASFLDSGSRPASAMVPTDFDCACLTTSTNGCARFWKSS